MLMVLMVVCFIAYLLGGGFDKLVSAQEKVAVTAPMPGQDYSKTVDPWEVILYEHPDFVGNFISYKMEPGMRHKLVERLPPEFEDKVSSIQVGSKVSVTVFVHRHWATDHVFGSSADAVFKASTAQVGSDSFPVNEKISSLIVYPNVLEHPIGV